MINARRVFYLLILLNPGYVVEGLCRTFILSRIPRKPSPYPTKLERVSKIWEIVQDIAPSILKSLKPSIEETIARSIEKSMMSCLNMAVETALRKFKEDVMDPQIEQKNGEIKML